jgi:hypothetical protein
MGGCPRQSDNGADVPIARRSGDAGLVVSHGRRAEIDGAHPDGGACARRKAGMEQTRQPVGGQLQKTTASPSMPRALVSHEEGDRGSLDAQRLPLYNRNGRFVKAIFLRTPRSRSQSGIARMPGLLDAACQEGTDDA